MTPLLFYRFSLGDLSVITTTKPVLISKHHR